MRRKVKTLSKKGFTLSELLVTLAIMAFVAIGAVGGIALILRMRNSFEQKNTATMLMTLTQQNLSRSLNREDGVTLVGEETDSAYHITINGVPLTCTPEVKVDDGSYITVEDYVYSSSERTYEYDLVVYSENNNEVMRQHMFIHVSAR